MFFHPFPLVNGPDRQTNKMKRCLLPFFRLLNGSISAAKGEKKIDPLRREIRKEVFFLSVGDAALRLCSSRKALMRLCTPAEFSFVPTTFFFLPCVFSLLFLLMNNSIGIESDSFTRCKQKCNSLLIAAEICQY